ncbi:MAG: imidazole glycerol phosphate synthase subunit HisH [Coriobacteriia bacterium]|nr:imidazole glycerol phosphate synthase subunit HisH [Coriobacteriia bacterium]
MIAVIDYQMGNLLSVERGLRGVGADARITADPAEIAAASTIVLPGVGAFSDAAASMRALGQMDVVERRVREGVPFLGICLGLHLMFDAGVEGAPAGETIPGMGLIPGVVDRMPAHDAQGTFHKVPHVGWNTIEPAGEASFASPLFEGIPAGEYFYFTHSYCAPVVPQTLAVTSHSVAFSSAVRFGEAAFGVQFHPEKSSDAGAAVLRNFARFAGEL